MIAVGSKAPDFILKDQEGKQVQLSELKGKKVLLSFHPLAWTWVCAEQMKSLEANYKRFEKLNTVALGLSVDAVPTKKAWARDLAIEKTRLLSDFWPHGEVAKRYDIFREKDGFSERANIIVDEDQNVIFAKTYPISQVPDIEEVIKFLAGKS
jgi:peroxiredoxin